MDGVYCATCGGGIHRTIIAEGEVWWHDDPDHTPTPVGGTASGR